MTLTASPLRARVTSNSHCLTAASAGSSRLPDDLTTRASLTWPSVPIVNSIPTAPPFPVAAGSEYFFRPGAVTSNPARNGPDGRSAGGGALGAGALGAGGGTMEDGGTVDRAPAGERRSGSPRRPRAVELRAAAGESASRAPTSGGTAETDGASAF